MSADPAVGQPKKEVWSQSLSCSQSWSPTEHRHASMCAAYMPTRVGTHPRGHIYAHCTSHSCRECGRRRPPSEIRAGFLTSGSQRC